MPSCKEIDVYRQAHWQGTKILKQTLSGWLPKLSWGSHQLCLLSGQSATKLYYSFTQTWLTLWATPLALFLSLPLHFGIGLLRMPAISNYTTLELVSGVSLIPNSKHIILSFLRRSQATFICPKTNPRPLPTTPLGRLLSFILTWMCVPFPITTLEPKLEAFDKFKVFHKQVERQLSLKITWICSNRWGECVTVWTILSLPTISWPFIVN